MPELPEVQTIVNDLKESGIVGCAFSRARVSWPATIALPLPASFSRQIVGRSVAGIDRRGRGDCRPATVESYAAVAPPGAILA